MNKIGRTLSTFGLDPFIIGLLTMILIARYYPEPGIHQGPFSLSSIANYGVSLILFFYGLKLNPEKLRIGLYSWKLHFTIQFFTFIIFPIIILSFYPLFKGGDNELLWLGTFYLAALPSTVSSSVVMVSIAKGNVPGAIFNASISSLIGVFITPIWMGLFLSSSAQDFQLWSVIGKLILQVLIPVILGILLYKKLGTTAQKYSKSLKYFDQLIILLIIYTSFSESFAKGMFQSLSIVQLFVLAALMLSLFFLIYLAINIVAKLFQFNKEDRISALFCGSKKSLVQGTVMSKVLFSGFPSVGLLLLPIMIYHALQLIVVSIVAQYMGRGK